MRMEMRKYLRAVTLTFVGPNQRGGGERERQGGRVTETERERERQGGAKSTEGESA